MEKGEIITRYGIYYDLIHRIGDIMLWHNITLSDLRGNKAKALIQRAYKDTRKDKLDLDIVEYICYIATLYLVETANVKERTPENIAQYIVDNFLNAVHETRALLRLFNRKPEYFMDLIGTDSLHIYREMSAFWYIKYRKDLLTQSTG